MDQEILDQQLHQVDKTDNQPYWGRQLDLVNDTSVYNKGLFGLIFCIIPGGIIGLVLVKICLDQASTAIAQYESDPDKYRPLSIQKVRTGKRLAQIGISIFILEILVFLAYSA